jgi:hypothetical protein
VHSGRSQSNQTNSILAALFQQLSIQLLSGQKCTHHLGPARCNRTKKNRGPCQQLRALSLMRPFPRFR